MWSAPRAAIRCALGLAVAGCLALSVPAAAAPTQVTLTLSGSHPLNEADHSGVFSAPPPFCPSGTWAGLGNGTRVFTCGDGSGTFTVGFLGDIEHRQGATGPWQITAGSGSYALLRGRGIAHIDSSSNPPGAAATFSETWTGFVDFDATPPAGSITGVKVTRPHARSGLWKVQVSFAARDDVEGNAVSYDARATAGPVFVRKLGTLTDGRGTFRFAFVRPKPTHVLTIQIFVRDPVGNQTTLARRVKLR
jgi:hypothetical protein